MRAGETFRFNGHHRKGSHPCGARFSVLATFAFAPGRQRPDGRGAGSSYWTAEDGREFELPIMGGFDLAYVCACGKRVVAQKVLGRYVADKKCDGRCASAKGHHSCECSCGGKNHGAAA